MVTNPLLTMRKWLQRRLTRHCVAEFFRADLRVRVLRVHIYDRSPFWLLWGLRGTYEYHLEFARRKQWGRFEPFATIRHLDMPTIAELLKPVNRYLNGITEPEPGFSAVAARELK